jgi:predicted O-linked N-acetylglucosamine transferase (SPINDLY family)
MALNIPNPAPPATNARLPLQAFRHWQAGQGHAQRQHWPAAAAAFEQATDLHADPAYGLAAAHALIKSGRAADAVQRARRLRRQHPAQLLGYTLESHALLALGRADEALACLRELPAGVAPDHAYLMSQAMALQTAARHAEAVPVFLQALALKVDDPYLHFHLGTSFKQLGLKAEAAECVRTAVTLGVGSSDLAARGLLVFLEREACRWAQADAELQPLRSTLRALPPNRPAETAPFAHAVIVGEPEEQLKVARHYAMHVAAKLRPLPKQRAQAPVGRLRLGYLSADFHNHATAQLLVQVLEQHDRGSVEVFALSAGPDDGSPLRRRVIAAVEHFVDLRGCSPMQMAQRVRELGIHILVDLKGATHDTLLPVLAARPAPLQVGWLGFPGSSGAAYIDYLIGDAVVTPLADAAHYSEKIAQMPVCYQPNDALRERPEPSSRTDWGLPEDALLLCAFHQSYKISAEVFDTWCTLLHERPDAMLWLLQWNANVQDRLCAEARARGIDAQRLLFAPLLPLQQHLSRLAHADIYLDTWPCNAHTTASEALWSGVPMVTLRGRAFAQRVAASLLHAVQLDQLVCDDVASYRGTVLALAADAPRRAALRAHLAQQAQSSPLFDGAAFARDLEALLQRMWQQVQRGGPLQHLPAQTPARARA